MNEINTCSLGNKKALLSLFENLTEIFAQVLLQILALEDLGVLGVQHVVDQARFVQNYELEE